MRQKEEEKSTKKSRNRMTTAFLYAVQQLLSCVNNFSLQKDILQPSRS